MLHVRTDEKQACVGAGLREIATLGEEAVAGMDGVGARCLCRRDDRLRIEIRRGALPRQQLNLVSDAKVQAARIILGMNCHRRQAHVGGGARDADGDFAAIGDQEFCDFHAAFLRKMADRVKRGDIRHSCAGNGPLVRKWRPHGRPGGPSLFGIDRIDQS